MNNLLRIILISAYLLSNFSASAQDKPNFKFGKVSVAEFSVPIAGPDTGAHAIIIGDIGKSSVVPNNKGGFGYQFERRLRMKIVDINGIEAGKFEIPLYLSKNSNAKEVLISLKAVTYNLEGGRIIESKLDNSQVFTENTSKYLQLKKFSLPALKAGSIFEITYEITSDFIFDFRPWKFQHEYPCLWSEYTTEIPEFFRYVTINQGYLPFAITKKNSEVRSFQIRNTYTSGSVADNTFTISGLVYTDRWVIVNVPALKQENFTTSIENHRSKIEFQLASINYPNQPLQPIMETWPKVTKDFMENENFGAQLDKNNGWMDEEIKKIIGDKKDPVEKARAIYTYVRDNFTCIQRSGLYSTTGLKNLLKTKSGNVADLNLLLIALLKHEKIECYPLILSTRSHGITNPIYPLVDRFNYVACIALIADVEYMLDASVPNLAFGKMDLGCYNGHARVLTENPVPIILSSDSILEKSTTMAIIRPGNTSMGGKVTTTPGYYESLNHREVIRDKGREAFFNKIKTSYGPDFEITNTKIDSLAAPESLGYNYEIQFKENYDDVVYLNPVITPFFKENPFASVARNYPVEMPYKIDETFILNLQLPENYVVDEMPKSAKVNFNEDEGFFEYLITAEEGRVQLRTRLSLAKANFPPEDYETLREFFGFVVKKQGEQIVLKKKSN